MDPKNKPYLNRSLKNIKGEKWKDIPGMEGYFKISNFGRIKRVAYQAIYKNGMLYNEQEMIMKPSLSRHYNNYMKDYTSYLRGRIVLEGVYYSFTISRMVYNCFVAPLDIKDFTRIIFYKDGDSFNLRSSNLQLATLSEKQKRIKQLKRSPSPMHGLTPEERSARQLKAGKKISKQVSQYNLNGKRVRVFIGAAEAERITGINACYIGQVASGKRISAGGYLWRFGKEQLIDIKPVLKMKNLTNSATGKLLLERQRSIRSAKPVVNVKVNTEKVYNIHIKHRATRKANKKEKA